MDFEHELRDAESDLSGAVFDNNTESLDQHRSLKPRARSSHESH